MKIKKSQQLNAVIELKNSCEVFKQFYKDQPIYLTKVNRISKECEDAINDVQKEMLVL